jgi:hypothetical protein
MHQDWNGPTLRLSDGITERIYDFKEWSITERQVVP